MASLHDLALRAAIRITESVPSPSPSPSGFGAYRGDEDLVSPTWVGFTATLLIAVAVVFLLLDMNRRVRRVRYRAEAREKIAAEQAEQAEAAAPQAKPGEPGEPAQPAEPKTD